MRKILSIALLSIGLASCKKQEANVQHEVYDLSMGREYQSKDVFAKALAAAVEKEPLIREFIKSESLKQFDHDFDVLYLAVKDVKLQDSETFGEKIAKYASSKEDFNKAVETSPLMTILVPELPEFDAFTWNTANQIPSVSIEPKDKGSIDDIKTYYGTDVEYSIPKGLIPSEPTIVVKENERLVVNNGGNGGKLMSRQTDQNPTTDFYVNSGGYTIDFAHPVFKNNGESDSKSINKYTASAASKKNKVSDIDPGRGGSNEGGGPRTALLSQVQPTVEAMLTNSEWHRDYIYYGINPGAGINSGKLNRTVRECLTAIRFTNADVVYTSIKRPGDPEPVQKGPIFQDWTNGSYEFRITALINSTNGTGSSIEKPIYVRPNELFRLGYRKIERPRGYTGPGTYFWEPYIDGSYAYILPTPLIIDAWDLATKSEGWKITLSRYIPNTVITTSNTYTSEFATNFEFSPTFGEIIKIGPKFGASNKVTRSQNHSTQISIGSFELGQANIQFQHPVWKFPGTVNGNTVTYAPWEVQANSNCFLTIEPRVTGSL